MTVICIVAATIILATNPASHRDLFCEGVVLQNTTDPTYQPWNTWTNTAFFIIPFLQVWFGRGTNFTLYQIGTPVLVAHIGLASLLYHRLQAPWTALWDVISIVMYIVFEFTTTCHILVQNVQFNIALYLLVSLSVGIAVFFRPDASAQGDYHMGVNLTVSIFLAATILLELFRPGSTWKSLIFLTIASILAVPSLILYLLSDHPDCATPVQILGHGWWHLTTALAILSLFVSKVSHLDTPPTVYPLEEFGLRDSDENMII